MWSGRAAGSWPHGLSVTSLTLYRPPLPFPFLLHEMFMWPLLYSVCEVVFTIDLTLCVRPMSPFPCLCDGLPSWFCLVMNSIVVTMWDWTPLHRGVALVLVWTFSLRFPWQSFLRLLGHTPAWGHDFVKATFYVAKVKNYPGNNSF